MTGEQYRRKAAEYFSMAKRETNAAVKKRYQQMALFYVDLAEQADKKPDYRFVPGVPAVQDQRSRREPEPESSI